MIHAYINIDKKDSSFGQYFEIIGINKLALKENKLALKDMTSEKKIDIVITSFVKYGETKKNLSDFESSNKPAPTLVIVDEKNFHQTVDLIKNLNIEIISNKSTIDEFEARVHALIGDSVSEVLAFKDLIMNLKTYDAKVNGTLLDLTFMEYELLKYFVENQDNVWSREKLLEKVWGYDYFGGARTVDVHVRRLRAKLGDNRADWIKTVHSVGYKFN